MNTAITVLLSVTLTVVNGGYLTGHHPLPSALSTRTIVNGGAIGGGPSNGAFSTSQFSQSVSSPAHVQSTISTYHPINHGFYAGQRNPGQNQGSNQGNYGYGSNIPNVIAYGSYGSAQGQRGLGGSQDQNQGYGGQRSSGTGGGYSYNGQENVLGNSGGQAYSGYSRL